MFKAAGQVLLKNKDRNEYRGEIMKKKSVLAMLMAVITVTLSLSGCGERTDLEDDNSIIVREDAGQTGCVEGCTCTGGCICNTGGSNNEMLVENITVPETVMQVPPQPEQTEEIPQTQTVELPTEAGEVTQGTTQQKVSNDAQIIAALTDGERQARREQQENFAEARQLLYELPNSLDKTEKINQMDRQILANNACYLGSKHIVFIGDSITEGITSAVDANGNFVSYVTYVNTYLHFGNLLNHGKGGRMFADYGGEELSLAMNFGNVTNIDSDVIVVFAGVNDYISTPNNKRFGNVDDKVSTAGYCGAVRSFMKQLQNYYADNDIFFVMMYNTSKQVQCTYSDVEGNLTLNDYLEVQRRLAKEYGFNVIELYHTGFMDCSIQEVSDHYLKDGLHPKDNGNIVLGEHIAAELSLYFGRKEVDQIQ